MIKIKQLKLFLLGTLTTFLLSCGSYSSPKSGSDPISHIGWDNLLKTYVNDDGEVNYKDWKNDRKSLDEYLNLLSSNPPDESQWTKNQQLAYWINAYNAFTIQLILDNYPLESITDLHPTVYIPGFNTIWHKEFFEIGGQSTSLDQIEHKILRKKFNEPRIHFAIVCASISCPKLRNQAYVAEKLEEQLNDQAIQFINDPTKNSINQNEIRISKIFRWFQGDFTREGSLVSYLNKFSSQPIDEKSKVSYMDYNWSLNGK